MTTVYISVATLIFTIICVIIINVIVQADRDVVAHREKNILTFVVANGYESPRVDGYWWLDTDVVPPTGCVGRQMMFSAVAKRHSESVDIEGCCNTDATVCKMITVQR